MTHRARTQATRDDWCTPAHVVERLVALGPIALDPCSNNQSLVPARVRWMASHGAASLRLPWGEVGSWYANPPFGDALPRWARKIAREGTLLRAIRSAHHGVATTPANTGSSWFARDISSASEILFWSPRLNFVGGQSNTGDTATSYWGPDPEAFRRVFAGCGWFRSQQPC